MHIYSSLKALLQRMPLILRWLAVYGLLGMVFVIGPLLPFANFSIDGKSVSWGTFWAVGAAPLMMGAGGYLFLMGCGLLLRKSWSRLLVLGLIPFSFALYLPFGGPQPPVSLIAMPFSVAWLLFMGWYLFRKNSAREFYELPSLTVRQALTFHSTGPAKAGQ